MALKVLVEQVRPSIVLNSYTKPEHADAYEAMLKPELPPCISKAKDYRGSYLVRREAGPEVEFITIMPWDSIDAILAIVGPDYETAARIASIESHVIPEEQRKYLSRHDTKLANYEIASIDEPSELCSVIVWRLRLVLPRNSIPRRRIMVVYKEF